MALNYRKNYGRGGIQHLDDARSYKNELQGKKRNGINAIAVVRIEDQVRRGYIKVYRGWTRRGRARDEESELEDRGERSVVVSFTRGCLIGRSKPILAESEPNPHASTERFFLFFHLVHILLFLFDLRIFGHILS